MQSSPNPPDHPKHAFSPNAMLELMQELDRTQHLGDAEGHYITGTRSAAGYERFPTPDIQTETST